MGHVGSESLSLHTTCKTPGSGKTGGAITHHAVMSETGQGPTWASASHSAHHSHHGLPTYRGLRQAVGQQLSQVFRPDE